MARVPVMNPPGKLTRPRLYRRKHRLYRGPKSTLKAHLRLANPKRKKRRSSAARKNAAQRRHAVAKVVRRHSRRHRRPRLFNPFGSELMMIGNPLARSGRKKRRNKMARKHRRSHRRLMNPFSPTALLSKPKEMFSKDFATEAVSVAAGFMAPNIVMGYLPVSLRDSKTKFYVSKVVVIAGLSTAAGFVSKRASRLVLIGGGVSLLLDLWAEFKARTAPAVPTNATPNVGAWYGDNGGVGAWYGNNGGMGDDLVMSEEPSGAGY